MQCLPFQSAATFYPHRFCHAAQARGRSRHFTGGALFCNRNSAFLRSPLNWLGDHYSGGGGSLPLLLCRVCDVITTCFKSTSQASCQRSRTCAMQIVNRRCHPPRPLGSPSMAETQGCLSMSVVCAWLATVVTLQPEAVNVRGNSGHTPFFLSIDAHASISTESGCCMEAPRYICVYRAQSQLVLGVRSFDTGVVWYTHPVFF